MTPEQQQYERIRAEGRAGLAHARAEYRWGRLTWAGYRARVERINDTIRAARAALPDTDHG